MTRHPPLVVWFNSPPVVERAAFDRAAELWGAPVAYVHTQEMREERRAIGWEASGSRDIPLIDATQHPLDRTFESLERDYPDALHVFAGFSAGAGKALAVHRSMAGTRPPAVFTERPGAYGPPLKRLTRQAGLDLKYRWIARRYRESVSLLMPLGETGVDTFRRHGWPDETLAPFMYCPPPPGAQLSNLKAPGETVRFIYAGRMTKHTKGADTLLAALAHLPDEGWTLDLIGGNGELVSAAENVARERPQVTYHGPLPIANMQALMSRAHVCLVPSKFDGWNVTTNHALSLGLGVLISDEAVSTELVAASGAGLVFSAGSSRSVGNQMRQAIESEGLVETWQKAARDYAPRITSDEVGSYLAGCLESALDPCTSTPPPPWI
jgi:glycosyltransferase involved in cell wall biosynthesis